MWQDNSKLRPQAGFSLLENLIAMLLLLLVGLGLAFVTARNLQNQHRQTQDSLALNSMRAYLQDNSRCAPDADVTLTLADGLQLAARHDCRPYPGQLKINGLAVNFTSQTLTVSAADHTSPLRLGTHD